MRALPSHSPHGECGLKFGRSSVQTNRRKSLPAWGVRVEMLSSSASPPSQWSLPAWGVRVEMASSATQRLMATSLPAWGVRVEICFGSTSSSRGRGHSPHGECGLKFARQADRRRGLRHSPHGECGLKLVIDDLGKDAPTSLPAWGVRVEICNA